MLRFETAIGTCGVRWSEQGITSVLLPGSRRLARALPHVQAIPAHVLAAAHDMASLLEGEQRDLAHIELDETALDDFRRAVYAATRAIPPGRTATYGEIAREIGDPHAARAVGSALGSNPYPIVVPCHRVLAADGALHGFSAPGGIDTKRRMLEIECAPGFTQVALFH
jgi:methylated-DNA-[protein]-cysteine S-methyltransferase